MNGEHGKLLDGLLELFDPRHVDYLAVDFTDREAEFVKDLDSQRCNEGVLDLTDKQAAWLVAIAREIDRQRADAQAPQ